MTVLTIVLCAMLLLMPIEYKWGPFRRLLFGRIGVRNDFFTNFVSPKTWAIPVPDDGGMPYIFQRKIKAGEMTDVTEDIFFAVKEGEYDWRKFEPKQLKDINLSKGQRYYLADNFESEVKKVTKAIVKDGVVDRTWTAHVIC